MGKTVVVERQNFPNYLSIFETSSALEGPGSSIRSRGDVLLLIDVVAGPLLRRILSTSEPFPRINTPILAIAPSGRNRNQQSFVLSSAARVAGVSTNAVFSEPGAALPVEIQPAFATGVLLTHSADRL